MPIDNQFEARSSGVKDDDRTAELPANDLGSNLRSAPSEAFNHLVAAMRDERCSNQEQLTQMLSGFSLSGKTGEIAAKPISVPGEVSGKVSPDLNRYGTPALNDGSGLSATPPPRAGSFLPGKELAVELKDRGPEPYKKDFVVDQQRVVSPLRDPFHPAPPRIGAVTPSSEEVSEALNTLDEMSNSDSAVAGVNGSVDGVAKDVSEAILSGKFSDVGTILAKLESDPNGQQKLKELALKLTQVLGTTVEGKIGENGKFSLDFLTHYYPATEGGYLGSTPEQESHLSVNSEGGLKASGGIYFDKAFASVEALRLRAVSVDRMKYIKRESEQ